MFRSAIKSETPMGLTAKKYIERGELVPDHIVWEIAREALEEIGVTDFILDGYPRTIQQAQWLDEYLHELGLGSPAVFSIELDDELIMRRLSRRRINKRTGESYHLDYNPPPPDVPQDDIEQRPDDTRDAIRRRIDVYRETTRPVKEYYRRQGLLHEICGDGGIEKVGARIEKELGLLEGENAL
jgi:adenylate kinase